MTAGFTGTQRGMTDRQVLTLYRLFKDEKLAILHHGDCIGADAQAHQLALQLHACIIIHPPEDPRKRAYSRGYNGMMPPLPYLERNRKIVEAADHGLFAAPRTETEVMRGSGTWATIRYARKRGRRIWLILPDGAIKMEARPGLIL